MSWRTKLFPIYGVMLASFAFGQTCDALLTHGLYNVSIATSERQTKAAEYSKICSSDYESSGSSTQRQMQASLSYAGFGVGGGSAKSYSSWAEAQSAYCNENKSNFEEDVSSFQEARQIYDRGIQAWERCVELASRNVIIDFAVNESSANATTVTYGISYTGAGTSGIDLSGLYVRPKDAFVCEGQLGSNNKNIVVNESTRRKISAQNLSVTCERKVTETRSDSRYYAPSTISIHTTDRNLDAFFPGVQLASSPDVVTLQQSISALEANLTALETSQNDLAINLSGMGSKMSDLLGPITGRKLNKAYQAESDGFAVIGGGGEGPETGIVNVYNTLEIDPRTRDYIPLRPQRVSTPGGQALIVIVQKGQYYRGIQTGGAEGNISLYWIAIGNP